MRFKEIFLYDFDVKNFVFFLLYLIPATLSLQISFNDASSIIITSIISYIYYLSVKGRVDDLVAPIRIFLILNLLAFFVQVLNVLFFGENTYIHGKIFSFSRQSYQLVELGQFYRFSGYHLEPGAYSTIVSMALIIYRLVVQRNDWIFFAALLSVPLTFSFVGVFLFFCISLTFFREYLFSRRGSLVLILVLLPIFLFIFKYLDVFGYLVDRFEGGAESDSSTSYKLNNLRYFFSGDFYNIFFGYGLGTNFPGCYECGHVTGNGSFFFVAYSFGLLFAIFSYGFVLFFALGQKGGVLFFVIFSLSRYGPTFFVYWLFLFLFFSATKSYRK
ncbi:hypothetical protein [Marinobacter sp. F4216]|uniref:hypothetical protein n=1 Tax=Marinobacter sp. F4216 TaxID=2874281 RepID=UPI001CBC70AC|nr:hypothetical protein [Marinobacter sp. F4216]MBZ2168429.1 hypothetical protein [Marinobacter sp. F4216]